MKNPKISAGEQMTETPAEKAINKPAHPFDLAKAISAHRGGNLHIHLHMHENEPNASSELPHIAAARSADDMA